jgi:cytochrome d ubiquinol oxidase subunit II
MYFPILLMLLGLIFRGVAFEFRLKAHKSRFLWDHAFFWGSLVATFSQGIVLGSFVQGFEVRGQEFAGSFYDWLRLFPLLVGLGLVFGYLLLGSTWLVVKTEGAVQLWAVKWARLSLLGVLAFIAMVSIWTPLSDPRIADRWFTWPNLAYLAPLPIATGFIALWLWRALDSQRDIAPFFAAIGLFALCFLGLGISLWPNIVPPNISLWEAAASPRAQAFLLIGTLFLLPIIVAYTAWSYYVFRGKVRADTGYH